MKIQSISHTLNISKNPPKYPSFSGGRVKSSLFKPIIEPVKIGMDRLTDKMAHGFAKLFEFKGFREIVEKTKDSRNLLRGLSCFVSFVLSGFYMRQTLKNKDLDPQRKKTLAINQGLCFAIPAVVGWVIDERTDKWIEKHFSNKYYAANFKHPEAKKLFHGIGAAKSMIVFGTMYRFIVPVFVTPLANHIGNKLQEKKEIQMQRRTEA